MADADLTVKIDADKLLAALDGFRVQYDALADELTERVARLEHAVRDYDAWFDDKIPARPGT